MIQINIIKIVSLKICKIEKQTHKLRSLSQPKRAENESKILYARSKINHF